MLRFAVDENFNNHILHGMLRRKPNLDAVRVQDSGLSSADDAEILAWAAREGRVLLTHDASTMVPVVERLLREGSPMAGVMIIVGSIPIAVAIEEILLAAECSLEGEWEGRIAYLPLP